MIVRASARPARSTSRCSTPTRRHALRAGVRRLHDSQQPDRAARRRARPRRERRGDRARRPATLAALCLQTDVSKTARLSMADRGVRPRAARHRHAAVPGDAARRAVDDRIYFLTAGAAIMKRALAIALLLAGLPRRARPAAAPQCTATRDCDAAAARSATRACAGAIRRRARSRRRSAPPSDRTGSRSSTELAELAICRPNGWLGDVRARGAGDVSAGGSRRSARARCDLHDTSLARDDHGDARVAVRRRPGVLARSRRRRTASRAAPTRSRSRCRARSAGDPPYTSRSCPTARGADAADDAARRPPSSRRRCA